MDATFWAFIALICFFLVLFYLKVPQLLGKLLDERTKRIQDDLNHAHKLREEALQLLDEYKKKYLDAELEANALIRSAKIEAQKLLDQAEKENKEYIARQNRIAKQRIELAEKEARQDIQDMIIDVSTQVSEKIIKDSLDKETKKNLFDQSLKELKNFNK